ncbi:ROK family protein [Arsenicitalea aurantiaca]|uniref:ROK family protein n=1 Tax=Arsenicitalea aurantiaca TaxID=1783274 RepID=A0A433XBD3_9HYPH|nr:ROK family protein [Arsenicitalea aurantiaca]RUT31364.1 ROK family protein [Arsenicitalea aurantiaca]
MEREAIGIDIGGTNIRAARIGPDGTILARRARRSDRDPAIVLEAILEMIGELDGPAVAAIGLGVPGRVNATTGTVLSGGYVDLTPVKPGPRIAEATGRPVIVDNDANMALAGEMALGAGRGHANIVMFTIGTGIGAAIADAGALLRGNGTAGQLGHLTVALDGPQCVCGRRGCVETLSSGTALGRHIAEAGLPAGTTADQLFAASDAGDARATAVLSAWSRPLRAAIDSMVAGLSPDLVILGGGLGQAAARAQAALAAEAPWYTAPIAAAELGDDAGVIGAGLEALRRNGAGPGRRVVLVNGIPASGKSSVSAEIATLTGWPVIALDTIKNPFLIALGGGDRPFNRRLGEASFEAMWQIVGAAPPGATLILDAWFGFVPYERLAARLAETGVSGFVEIWCHAPGPLLGERYAARLGTRPAGHPGAEYVPELIALAERAEPFGRGETIPVDTSAPIDAEALARQVRTLLGRR